MSGPQWTTQPENSQCFRQSREELDKLTSGYRQSKAGQSGLQLAATVHLQKCFLFPFSSPVSKLMTSFSPLNRGQISLLQTCASHSHDTHCLPTHRVCPQTFTISFKEGFRYLVVLHRGQPWSSMAPSFLRTPPDVCSSHGHSHLQAPPDPTPGRFLPTGTWLRRSLYERAPAGARHCSTKVPAASFPVPPLVLSLSFREPAQYFGYQGRTFKKAYCTQSLISVHLAVFFQRIYIPSCSV